jgi:hypothetical protein
MGCFMDTIDTTRIRSLDPITLTAEISQLVYPSRYISWRPKVAILVPDNYYPFSFMAASLVHMPFNGTFLFSPVNRLVPATIKEIIRLAPRGDDLPAQVFLVGPFATTVERELQAGGYKTHRFTGENIYELAAKIAMFRLKEFPIPEKKCEKHLLIVSGETGIEALPAVYYSAHSGIPIVFVKKTSIPQGTKELLKSLSNYNVTIFGSDKTISKEVEREIRKLAEKTERVDGRDPYEIAVNFAKREEKGHHLGWGRNTPREGDAFTFGVLEAWQNAVGGLALAHHGKHTPLLLIKPEEIPEVVSEYLHFLNPPIKKPKPPFMHGFILGSEENISFETQIKIEEHLILKIKDH